MSDIFHSQDTGKPESGKFIKISQKLRFITENLSRSISYFLGLTAIILAGMVMVNQTSVSEITNWAAQILGLGFMGFFSFLLACSLYSLVHMTRLHMEQKNTSQKNMGNYYLWLETGLHSASGITTLALTFTLLGISLGIGGLSEQVLTPDTIQEVIRKLTAQFSLAFMTTVIGLPTAAFLRAVLLITHAHLMGKADHMRPMPPLPPKSQAGEV